jgi:hypothetical protein
MREEIQTLRKLIRSSIEEAQLRCQTGPSDHRMRTVIALLWSAHDELEMVAAPRLASMPAGAIPATREN